MYIQNWSFSVELKDRRVNLIGVVVRLIWKHSFQKFETNETITTQIYDNFVAKMKILLQENIKEKRKSITQNKPKSRWLGGYCHNT